MYKITVIFSCALLLLLGASCKRSFQCDCEGHRAFVGDSIGPPKATIEIKTTKKSRAEHKCREVKSSGNWYRCGLN